MMKKPSPTFSISLSFESIALPPFSDMLILTKKCPQGIVGISSCFQILAPDQYHVEKIEDDRNVMAVLINHKILQKIPAHKIINVLRNNVFPYVGENEIVKVDSKIILHYENITGNLDEG